MLLLGTDIDGDEFEEFLQGTWFVFLSSLTDSDGNLLAVLNGMVIHCYLAGYTQGSANAKKG